MPKQKKTKEELLEAKRLCGEKAHASAPMIVCACGCDTMIKSKDKYHRNVKYAYGHGNRKYQDPRQFKREWSYRNREKLCQKKKDYGRKRKVELIILKGGECCKCNIKYDGKNATIFDLHHIEPEKKEMSLNVEILQSTAFEKVLEELKKCELICSNCHRLLHTGGW